MLDRKKKKRKKTRKKEGGQRGQEEEGECVHSLAQPSLQGIMSRTIPPNAQGELQGAIAALNSLTMVFSPWIMTQLFAAFSSPGEPFTLFGATILPDGAPFYFPGAPLIFAFVLELFALALLFLAFRQIQRPREEAAAAAEEAAEQPSPTNI